MKRVLPFLMLFCVNLLLFSEEGFLIKTIKAHNQRINSLSFNPSKRQFLSASFDRTIKIWNIDDFSPVETISINGERLLKAVYSPVGNEIAFLTPSSINILDPETKQITKRILIDKNNNSINPLSLSYSFDGKYIMTNYTLESEGSFIIKLWNVKTKEVVNTIKKNGFVSSAIFSKDQRYIISSSQDSIDVWDVKTGNLLKVIAKPSGVISKMAMSSDGKYLAEISISDFKINVFDLDLFKFAGSTEELGSENGYINYDIVYSPDDRYIITGGDDKKIYIVDAKRLSLFKTLSGYTDRISSLLSIRDKKLILVGTDDGSIGVLNYDALSNLKNVIVKSNNDQQSIFNVESLFLKIRDISKKHAYVILAILFFIIVYLKNRNE